MGKLSGKVALVTGGASGIGRASALALAAEGAAVGIVDRNLPGAEDTAAEAARLGVKSVAAEADVADEAQVAAAFGVVTAALGDIDILFNNAGIDTTSLLIDMPTEMWDEMIRINLRSMFVCTKQVLPAMQRKKWGRIINTASQLGHKGAATMVHYCAAKAGVIGFTRSLAYEVALDGITVNAICPVRSIRRWFEAFRRPGSTRSKRNWRSDGLAGWTRWRRRSCCWRPTLVPTTSVPR